MPWIVVVGLIGINAFYVAAEFGAVSVRQSQVRHATQQGNGFAARLLPILRDAVALDRYIAACQIGITWSSLALGAYSQATLSVDLRALLQHWFDLGLVTAQSGASVGVLVGMTTLQVVFGELVPKSLALQAPLRVSLLTVLPMLWSVWFYHWFLKVLNGSGLAVLRALGFHQTGHRHIHSPDEIDFLVAESAGLGELTPSDRSRLHRALRLASRPVRQLMTPRRRVAALRMDLTPPQVLQVMLDSPYSALPVYRDSLDHFLGIVHVKDLARHYMASGQIPPIESILRKAQAIPETAKTDRLLALFREHGTHQALVLDEYGVVGLVTVGDVLAELLGEFGDEFKTGRPQPERLADGRVRLPGWIHLDEAAPWVGVHWEGEADTVSGHIVNTIGRLPSAGERLAIDGVELEIELVANQIVEWVLATPARPQPGGEE